MTHARLSDFSQPPPARGPARASAPVPADHVRPAPARMVIVADRPDTPHVRAARFLVATGETLTAVLIIAGGVLAYGYLPFA